MEFSVLFRWRLDSAMVTSQTAKGGHLPRLELLEPDDVDVMCRATGACRWVRRPHSTTPQRARGPTTRQPTATNLSVGPLIRFAGPVEVFDLPCCQWRRPRATRKESPAEGVACVAVCSAPDALVRQGRALVRRPPRNCQSRLTPRRAGRDSVWRPGQPRRTSHAW